MTDSLGSIQTFTKDGSKITLEINKDNYPEWAKEITLFREFFKIFGWEEK